MTSRTVATYQDWTSQFFRGRLSAKFSPMCLLTSTTVGCNRLYIELTRQISVLTRSILSILHFPPPDYLESETKLSSLTKRMLLVFLSLSSFKKLYTFIYESIPVVITILKGVFLCQMATGLTIFRPKHLQ